MKRKILDLTGGTINVKYNDGSIEEIALTSDSVKVSGFRNTIKNWAKKKYYYYRI